MPRVSTATLTEQVPNAEPATGSAIEPAIVAMPWSNWPEPEVFNTTLRKLRVELEDGDGGARRPIITRDGERIGPVNDRLMKELGWAAAFPAPFIGKLQPETARQVINERIDEARDREATLIAENDVVTSFVAGWRGILPFAETAQTVYDAMQTIAPQLEVAECQRADGTMLLRVVTDRREPVTRAVGDVLQQGIEVRQAYGTGITASLYARRLVCLNGMTSTEREFEWRSRGEGTPDHQRNWLRTAVAEVTERYEALVRHAQQMAAHTFNGNPRDVLQEHARAMRLPMRHFEELVDAFNQEPGNTYWHLANAMTRLATHGERLSERNRRRLSFSAGEWAQDFDFVHCRLPRPVAERLGAEIIEDPSDGDNGDSD